MKKLDMHNIIYFFQFKLEIKQSIFLMQHLKCKLTLLLILHNILHNSHEYKRGTTFLQLIYLLNSYTSTLIFIYLLRSINNLSVES